jgi:hypothetical protein
MNVQSPLVDLASGLDVCRMARRHPERLALVLEWMEREVLLRDGTVGYYMRFPRFDDCWAAAVATCLQVPLKDVPDPCLDERLFAGEDPDEIERSAWREMHDWLADRRLRMIVHRKVPAPRRRWVGVVPVAHERFGDHCLVMSRSEVLFDPISNMGMFKRFDASAIRWGFSFRST